MANAIVGTLILVGLACVLGLPVGVMTGVYLAEYGHGRFGWAVRFCADVLNGVPSIVIGIYAYTLARPSHAQLLGIRGRLRAGRDHVADRRAHHRGDGASGAGLVA